MLNWLDKNTPSFPEPATALRKPEGLLCAGGNLDVETLLKAYQQGIFPWFNEDQPILWWSPDPRMVLFPSHLHISTSMKKWLKKSLFTLTWNNAFESVVCACAHHRSDGTWITDEMIDAYVQLHKQGCAQSVEIWDKNELVGGLYGPFIGEVFFGESMFSLVTNASKMALINLAQSNHFKLIDCQFQTAHLQSLGAGLISREQYLKYLKKYTSQA